MISSSGMIDIARGFIYHFSGDQFDITSRRISKFRLIPSLPPDVYEPDDNQDLATPLVLSPQGFTDVPDLSMGTDGVDWYEINMPAMTHLSIDVVYDQNLGALSADLWDRRGVNNPLSFGLPVAQDFRGTGTSRLVYVNTTAPERLYLRVFGDPNPAYAMMIETIVEDDQYDVGGIDNNSPCAPSIIPTIAANTEHRNLVLRDDDWYRVQLPPGTTELDMRVEHGFFSGDLNVMVIGDNPADCAGAFGRIIAGSYGTGPGDDEVLSGVNVTGRSSVLIRVYGANLFMRNIYDLHLTTR